MALRIYNTLTRTKEVLTSLTPGEVRMYVCGVTVYDLAHVGHARSALVFDVIRRWLMYRGYRVKFVKNFTDVDDKIIKRAQEEGVSASELSERYIAEYRRDMEALGVLPADVEPKATEHIPQMIALIKQLIAAGFAYEIDGDVYFEVRRFPRYGRLSGKNLEELLAGARVDVDERKRDPRDFALWKSAKPGEPSWGSPWGPGRPGWHIECSAMSMEYLGETFDIHGGGEDLIFPHHECEIAQSETATGKPFVRYWMHNAFVNVGTEKMSKSLGNILTIDDLVKRHRDSEALRLYLLRTHYRSPIEWSEEKVVDSARDLDSFRMLVSEGKAVAESRTIEGAHSNEVDDIARRFEAAMDDDFSTPQAVAVLFALRDFLGTHRDLVTTDDRAARSFVQGAKTLARLAGAFGLLERPSQVPEGLGFIPYVVEDVRQGPREGYQYYASPVSDAPVRWWADTQKKIESLVAQRSEARKNRDWKRADELRAELQALGVMTEDTPAGTRWRWKGA